MILTIKELIVILAIAAAVFKFAKPVALQFTAEKDFSRRRNVWFALTAVAFLSTSFWLFVLIAIPLLISSTRKDSNPAALYLLLLHVIPPISVSVPMVGMSYLFDLDNYLLLAFCVMVPAAAHLLRSQDANRIQGLKATDYCLLAYGCLSSVFFVHPLTVGGELIPSTFTDCLRRAFVFFFNIFIPFFVISRTGTSRRAIVDNLAAFCLSCALMAAIAIFEGARHWLLYNELADRWGFGFNLSQYISRGESIRAMASSGHSLALGFLLAIAFGFWLYLQSFLSSTRTKLAVSVLLWFGLFAAYSRGPWLVAVSIYLVYAALSPSAFARFFKAGGLAVFAGLLISLTPLGDRIVRVLPFMGGAVDSENVVYRQRLMDRGWQVIHESPFFGDPDALLKLHDLRQGQGIVDLINSYIGVLLNCGFVGLFLLLSTILIGLFKAKALSKRIMRADPNLGLLGVALVSCILGTLLMMIDGSFGTGVEKMYYVLAALAMAYAHLGKSQSPQPTGNAVTTKTPHAQA